MGKTWKRSMALILLLVMAGSIMSQPVRAEQMQETMEETGKEMAEEPTQETVETGTAGIETGESETEGSEEPSVKNRFEEETAGESAENGRRSFL